MTEETRNIIPIFADKKTDEIRTILYENANKFDVLALNIHSCLNIGNMMRTANLCGVRKFIVFGRRNYDKRSCVGAQHYITIERVSGLKNGNTDLIHELTPDDYEFDEELFIEFIIKNKYLPVFIEQDKTSLAATTENIKKIIANAESIDMIPLLIFGNESTGIPFNLLQTKEHFEKSYTLELNQMGCIQSFNVSNCFAIICYKFMEAFL
jgi:tRNA G18 (ribose-2'-O)-methylase SpoU